MEKTLTVLPSTSSHDLNDAGSVDLLGHVACQMTSPASAMISPVEGSATGIASVKPLILPRRAELLVELIAADIGDVVAAAVKEQSVEQGLGAFNGGRIAGAQLAVDLHKALVTAGGGVLINGDRLCARHRRRSPSGARLWSRRRWGRVCRKAMFRALSRHTCPLP